MSYNSVKNNRASVVVGGVKFITDGINNTNLPF